MVNEYELFKDSVMNCNKLTEYGFILEGNKYIFSKQIFDNQFILKVFIDNLGNVLTKLIDYSTNDEYVLHKMNDVSGSFVGKLRTEYLHELNNIKINCFEKTIFKSKQCQDIIKYVKSKYNDDLEFLWEKSTNNAILRRQDNKKWYAAILTINYNKIDANRNELIEIIDLKADNKMIDKIIDNHTIFPGFHMNKNHWITIPLNYSMSNEKLFAQIDNSYNLAQ